MQLNFENKETKTNYRIKLPNNSSSGVISLINLFQLLLVA